MNRHAIVSALKALSLAMREPAFAHAAGNQQSQGREPWTPIAIVGSGGEASEGKTDPGVASRHDLFTNVALLASAPFIGLLGLILLPFVGLALVAWSGGKALFESAKVHEALRFGKKMLLTAPAPAK